MDVATPEKPHPLRIQALPTQILEPSTSRIRRKNGKRSASAYQAPKYSIHKEITNSTAGQKCTIQ
jgi:hypothetical protein